MAGAVGPAGLDSAPGPRDPAGGQGGDPDADRGQPYSRAERLLNLLMALRGTRTGLDRDTIRSVVRGYDQGASAEAFQRMFERDKDELRAMGVPVVTLTDASGVVTGYRIQGEWTLPPLELTRMELAVLGLAARAWQSAELAPAALNALRKVEARLGMASTPSGAPPIAGLTADSPVLPALIAACSARTPVSFDYRTPDGPMRRRHVEPWGVVWWRAHWYLVGHDTDRSDVRVFRASRIEGAVHARVAGPGYQIPAGFDARAAVGRFAEREQVEIEVALSPGTGASLRQEVTTHSRDARGWDLLRLRRSDLRSGVAEILAFGSGARVVGPPEAMLQARGQLEAIRDSLASEPEPRGRPQPTSGTHAASSAQFSRLLALVPWLAANSGVTLTQAAAHFGITVEQLVSDLGSVITSGADDWTLFDIQYWDDDGVIEVIDALDLAEPLTLTPEEGFALLVALHALAAVPGVGDRAVLESVTAALNTALGTHAPSPGAVSVRVDLPDEVVDSIDRALAAGRALELTYLGAVRDAVTQRVVDPIGVVVVDGYAYLRGHCRSAGGVRLFRLDRILDLRISALPALPVGDAPDSVEPMAVALAATGRRVLVDVPAGSAVLDRHPATRRWALPGGAVRVELPVGDYGWARRLVLGSAGEVVLREPRWLVEQLIEETRAALAGQPVQAIG